ncbi:putative phosphatidylinositol 4-kinase type 2-beta [Acorus calamus]|uniref:1-phosphatidylinositol 4-kinase n=1 Tax=Acorus calamus TaxID=4465 RepID=A0AAV9ETD5_ACOCL|nr:putative phosphatidylinositol 4-kinase type 2-beta [Acorus calamus]
MSPNLDSPVQTQLAVAIPNRSLSSEFHGLRKTDGKPVGRRRVFVQTETGCVLGLELDRSDNAHTVKRRLQLALNIPTDESSLTFGDLVLKNDLSTVRNDSPLLLTRNFLHRSSSTPCLSPRGKELQQRDQSGLIEIIGCSSQCSETKQLVKDAVKAIKSGVDPIPVHSGLGGAYYFRNSQGFVGKALGQPGLKRSVRVGETGFREVAAYLLDYDHFANVPPTVLVKITHSVFNVNEGMNTGKAAINHSHDRNKHGGNLLVRKLDKVGRFGQVELIPIDHGLCLPESLEDPYFEWIHWPQASIPFSEDELEYIANLDPVRDADMLRMELPMIRDACLRVLVLCTVFLKEAAAFGLCLAEIGEMMSREFKGVEEEPSELEVVCIEARRLVAEREAMSFCTESEVGDAENYDIQFEIDCDDDPYFFGSNRGSVRNPLSKLDESVEEEETEKKTTLINISLSEKSQCFEPSVPMTGGSSGNRSANEQLPTSASFVKLADMSDEEWGAFLEKFQELLGAAFHGRRFTSAGARQRQRLGTSCQF